MDSLIITNEKIHCFGDRILIEPLEKPVETTSGVLLDGVREQNKTAAPQLVKVISVGPTVKEAATGDVLLVVKYASNLNQIQDSEGEKTFWFINESDDVILAKIA